MVDEIVCESVPKFWGECDRVHRVRLYGIPSCYGDSVTMNGVTIVYRPPHPVDPVLDACREWWDSHTATRPAIPAAWEVEDVRAAFRAGRDFGLKQALEKCTARRDATAPHYVGGCREGVDWCLAIMRSLRKPGAS